MRKDITRDYVTEAFRLYARLGKPTYEQARQRVYDEQLDRFSSKLPPEKAVEYTEKALDKHTPFLLDIMAVNKTIELLEQGKKEHIIKAIESIYFIYPEQQIYKGEISGRVRHFACRYMADERTIYRWLKEARLLCAAIRGLRIVQLDREISNIVK